VRCAGGAGWAADGESRYVCPQAHVKRLMAEYEAKTQAGAGPAPEEEDKDLEAVRPIARRQRAASARGTAV